MGIHNKPITAVDLIFKQTMVHLCLQYLRPSLPQWQSISLAVIEKVQIAAAILGSMFLVASLSWLVWSSFSPSARWQRHDLLFQICYGMYGFMDIVCFGEAEPYSSLQPWLTDSQCNGWQLLVLQIISL